MKYRATIALFGVLTLVGCENMGLEYAGTGEEGRNRAPSDLASAVHRAAPAAPQPVIANGRRWVPGGEPIALNAADLRSVGSSAGQTLYARHWDDAPFDMLFIRAGSLGTAGSGEASAPSGASGEAEWQSLLPVIGEDGGPAAQGEPAAH